MAETIKIGGEIESTATGNKVADIANVKDKTKGNKSQAEINAEHETALADRYTKAETYNKSQVNQMVAPQHAYITVETFADLEDITEHPEGCVYRVSNYDGTNSQVDATMYSEYGWDGTQYIHLATKSQIGEVFDISAYHATGGTLATYDNLNDALNGTNGGVPQSLQKGGMSVKFVQSSDNKYVQYRLMSDSFNTTPANWQGVDDEPIANSKNLVESGGVYKKIDDINRDIHGYIPIDDYEKENYYRNTNSDWKLNTNYELIIIPVTSSDVIMAEWKGTGSTTRGYRYIVSEKPIQGITVNNLLPSSNNTTVNEEFDLGDINGFTAGYFCFQSIYSTKDVSPVSLKINGNELMLEVKGVDQKIEDIETELLTKATTEHVDSELLNKVNITDIIDTLDSDDESKPLSAKQGKVLSDEIGTVPNREIIVSDTTIIDISKTFDGTETGTQNIFNSSLSTPIQAGHKVHIVLSDPDNVIRTLAAGKQFFLKINNGTTLTVPIDYTFVADILITQLRIYLIQGGYNDGVAGTISLKVHDIETGFEYYNLQQQIIDSKNEAKSNLDVVSRLSHEDMFELESDWWIKEKYLESVFSDSEQTALTTFISKIQSRDGEGKYQIAVISDTHGSGAYSWRSINEVNRHQSSCFRSIAVFNKIMQYCDAGIHGGDLSCDYGTSRQRDLQYMSNIVRMFKAAYGQTNPSIKPFFITKGNHDENNNGYVEVFDQANLDWENNAYYIRNFSTFTQVTESTWDGSPLYVLKTELVSDREFRNVVQHWMSPSGSVWGNGAYYYYDIDSVKIRFIVANSFPVNDNRAVYENEEYLWFAQEALNLSSKDNPQEWQVMVLRHTQSTSITALTNCINAFRNGTSWTYEGVTVDFGSMNGGGCTFIAHIHGHEHQWCFSNGAGYFDIGENSSFVTLNYLGDASKYGISVWTIDTVNKKAYEDTIAGNTWVYDYDNGYAEIGVGEVISCAESGLSGTVTCSSSDNTIASCNGRIITGVSAGTAIITVSGSGGSSYSYLVKVV